MRVLVNQNVMRKLILSRVGSSEISGGKFPEIYSNLSGNIRKLVNCLCPSAVSNSSIEKRCCKV